MFINKKFFSKGTDSKKVFCKICANYCRISENNYGICKQYKNVNNQLFNWSYGQISSVNTDPIEKKPLYNFLPGSLTYSLGGLGCNMGCLNCQNYIISHNYEDVVDTTKISPERIVENAINTRCRSISWTYNEPTIHLPFNSKASFLGREKNLKIVYVSNGYMSDESLDEILKFVDAFSIDLKSFSQKFYKNICNAKIDVVLENLKKIYNAKKHLEITNLLINGYNDSNKEINNLVEFIICELGKEVPLHFSRAFPHYKMMDITPTNEDKLFEAKKIAEDLGIQYVYIGNTPYNQNTYCPRCGQLLFKRNSYLTEDMKKIKNKKCCNCGKKLNIIID